jgi:hypothetical protein
MPLHAYAPFFSTHEVDVMSLAFNSAWQELTASVSPSISSEQIETLRAKLAECVVISALDISAEEPEENWRKRHYAACTRTTL